MDYEKAYKEALERARQEIQKYPKMLNIYAKAFPELAESEDERIRKGLISYFEIMAGNYFGEFKKSDILAYLEKQKEQKGSLRVIKDASEWEKIKEQQPAEKPNLVAQLREHLANTPKEQLEKEWKELEPWNNIGPTVKEFLYSKTAEWSDEDKKWFNVVSQCGLTEGTIDWIRSLINRYYWKPSEEQMQALKHAYSMMNGQAETDLANLYYDLKKLM